MRKLALLLAAALMASAPVVAAMTTDGYAATKKAKRVAKATKIAQGTCARLKIRMTQISNFESVRLRPATLRTGFRIPKVPDFI